jgi:hypothetical protein
MVIMAGKDHGAKFSLMWGFDGNGWHGFLTTVEEETPVLVTHFWCDLFDDLSYLATAFAERYCEGLEIQLVQPDVPATEG